MAFFQFMCPIVSDWILWVVLRFLIQVPIIYYCSKPKPSPVSRPQFQRLVSFSN
uniref:Uncharacterized protein n=1 Tax=Meloidogyne incognita TaxID=6306 RepID=A0A914KPI8_MELIC